MNPGKNLFLFVLAGQKKRRRRNRWSSGICVKRKHASPHTPREDAHFSTDEEEEDDEDAERGGREKQRAMGAKAGSTPAEASRIEPGGVGNNVEAQTEKIINVEEDEPTQLATPGTRRAVRGEPNTGEMVSSRDSNEKLTEFVYVFQRGS